MMPRITPTQARILETLILNQKANQDSSEYGTSLYELRKLGIPGRTFEINRESLLYQQFIWKVRDKVTGLQTRTYYEITVVGVSALLESMKLEEIQQKFDKNFATNYFPLIAKHWKELITIYHENLVVLLKISIDQLDIKPSNDYSANSPSTYSEGEGIHETMMLPYDPKNIEIAIHRNYETLSEDELVKRRKIFRNSKLVRDYVSSINDEINLNFKNRLTFVFYFNLIRSYIDSQFLVHLTMSTAQLYLKEHNLQKTQDRTVKDQEKKIFERADKEFIRINDQKQRVFTIIKNDEELIKLFNESFDEINKMIPLSKFLKDIKKEILQN